MQWHLVAERGCRKGLAVNISEDEFRLGRASTCQLRPASMTIAWVHCILRRWDDRLFVESGSASTQTFVNGVRIQRLTELHIGDRLAIGPLSFLIGGRNEGCAKSKPGYSSQEDCFGSLLLSVDEMSSQKSLAETANHTAFSSMDTATEHPATRPPVPPAQQPPATSTSSAADEILHQYLRRSR